MENESGKITGVIEATKIDENRFAVLIQDIWYSQFGTAPEWLEGSEGVEVSIKWVRNKGFYNIDSIVKTGVQGTIETSQGSPKSPKTSTQGTIPGGGIPIKYKQAMNPEDRHSIERQKSLDIANQMVVALLGNGVKIPDVEKRVEEIFQKYLKLIQNR